MSKEWGADAPQLQEKRSLFFMTPESLNFARARALRVQLLAQNIHVLRGIGGSPRVSHHRQFRTCRSEIEFASLPISRFS